MTKLIETFLVFSFIYLGVVKCDTFQFNKTLTSSYGQHVSKTVQKKTFSNSNRLLFVAGLEGTGHHAMKAMFQVCQNMPRGANNSTNTSSCESEESLSLLFMNTSRYSRSGLFMTEDHKRVGKVISLIKQRMHALSSANGSHLYFLGTV